MAVDLLVVVLLKVVLVLVQVMQGVILTSFHFKLMEVVGEVHQGKQILPIMVVVVVVLDQEQDMIIRVHQTKIPMGQIM